MQPRLITVLLAAGLLAVAGSHGPVLSQPTEAQSAQARHYQIAAGPLGPALAQFGAQAGVVLAGASGLVQGRQSAGLSGRYTVSAGLAVLLAGTGLEAFWRPDGSVGLRAASVGGAVSLLQPVTVKAHGPSTEGTGSYVPTGPSSVATGMDMTLQQTPQSVSVITDQQMKDFGLESMDDVLSMATGVNPGTAGVGGGHQFTARGFNVSNIRVDGMEGSYRESGRGPFNPTVLDMALYDRVEVVRGATGLLTGPGDPSATVNLVRKRPEREFAGSVQFEGGSWNRLRLAADASIPLTQDGRVRMRVIGAHRQADSFRNFQSDRVNLVSGVLEADLTSSTLLTIGHDDQRSRLNGEANAGLPLFDAAGNRIDVSRALTVAPPWTYWNKHYQNTFAYLAHEFDNRWRVQARYSHQRNEGDALVTGAGTGLYLQPDGSGISLRTNLAAYGYRRQDSVELSASGPFSLFGREHQLAVGFNGSRTRDTSHTMQARTAPDYWIPNFHDWQGGMPQPEVFDTGARTVTHTRHSGAYLSGRFNLAEPLNLIVGVRTSRYETHRDNYGTSGQFLRTDADLNSTAITPYVGLTYDITPEWTAYASYTEIFKPQRYRDKFDNFLDPITGDNVEVGLKGTLLDGRLNLTLAAYQARQNNLAEIDNSVPPNSLPDGGQAYVSTGPGNRSRGFEIEVAGEPTPGWRVSASFSQTMTKDGQGARINTYIPVRTFKLGTNYRFQGRLHGLSVGGTVHWYSQRVLWGRGAGGAVDIPGVGQRTATHPAYAVVGLHANYRINKHLRASLHVNNVFDKRYYQNFVAFRAQYGAPRHAYLSMQYQW